MGLAQKITSMVLALRRKVNIKVRQPLQAIMIPAIDETQKLYIEAVKDLVLGEVNVKELKFIEGQGILVKKVKCNFRTMGKKFGKLMKSVAVQMDALGQEEIARLENEGHIRLLIDGQEIDFGAVGDVDAASVNTDLFESLCSAGLTPVVCAINHDGKGNLLNTNADTIASSIAVALKAELVYCFEKNGVLMDRDDEESVIPSIDREGFEKLKAEGKVADGMIPKLSNAFRAIGSGVERVVIKHASNLLNNVGTVLK